MKYDWSDSREACRAYFTDFSLRFVPPEEAQKITDVVDRACDLHEGSGSIEAFLDAAVIAMSEGRGSIWESAAIWIGRAAEERPVVNDVWDTLAKHRAWQVRWRVSCVLYHNISESKSDELFAILRHDKSEKVRRFSVDRYENRPGPDRIIVFKMFDAANPLSPGYRES